MKHPPKKKQNTKKKSYVNQKSAFVNLVDKELGLLYTYCDILLGKRKNSDLFHVKFDPDWSDDFSY